MMMMMMMACYRPMINNKFEEKTCGDGPSLSTMFSDDKNMQSLIENIQVRRPHTHSSVLNLCSHDAASSL